MEETSQVFKTCEVLKHQKNDIKTNHATFTLSKTLFVC